MFVIPPERVFGSNASGASLPETQAGAAQGFGFEAVEAAPGVHLHVNSTKKRKTNRFALYWIGDLSEADVTARALLTSVMARGTRSHPSQQAVHQHLEYLYGATLSSDVMKVGERHIIAFRGEFVNDRYLPADEGILDRYIDFAREFIQEPHLEDGKFPEAVLEQEKVNHQRYVESLLNDKRSYAYERCLQHMCPDEPYRLYEYGAVEDLDAIDSAQLLDILESSKKGAETHIYFSGDIEPEAASSALSRLVASSRTEPASLRPRSDNRSVGELRQIEETLDVQQSQLILGYRAHTRFGDESMPALVIANGILGLFAHSKLFVNVREKESLCYAIGSELDRSQGLLFISAGIEVEKAEQARNLIEKQVHDLQAGDFTDDDLLATQAAFLGRLSMLEDNPAAFMGIDLTWRLAGGRYDHDSYCKSLQQVTRDQVVEAAGRLELDTVYLLRPDSD